MHPGSDDQWGSASRPVFPGLPVPGRRGGARCTPGGAQRLRTAAARCPADPRLRRLIAQPRAGSERFADLWDSGTVGRHGSAGGTEDHPQAGPLTLDCDVLMAAADGRRTGASPHACAGR
ncbi:hypothetical protein [Streptomyces wuyuanensis]|uniref:MmyB family transcriptional regulator n=1 Tax=Streptomyces wuyuanensis TaxID=1196353 RepID=UPI0037B39285